MATAAVPTGSTGASTSGKNVTDEERRWVVVGICLSRILTPALTKVVSNEIPKWHQTLIKPPIEINKQTSGKHVKNLPPSTMKLNYESINNNAAHKSTKLYDYAVKDPLSLAKLFVKPFMASFTGFDHTMDTSAVLSVMCEAQPFIASGAAVLAKKVRSDIRNEWAHCDFSQWTEPNYQSAIKDMESLVKQARLTPVEEKLVLDDLDVWKKTGKKLCLGEPIAIDQRQLVETEAAKFVDLIKELNTDADKRGKLLNVLQHFHTVITDEVGTTTMEIPCVFDAPKLNPRFAGILSEIKGMQLHNEITGYLK